MKVEKLATVLVESKNSCDYFSGIFEFASLDPRNAMKIENDSVRRVVFFGQDFTPQLAEVILQCPASKTHFRTVRELRLVATKIGRALAKGFKTLNPEMRVVWVSVDEWLNRPVASPDLVTPSVEVPENSRNVF